MLMPYSLDSPNLNILPGLAHLCGLLEQEPKALQKTKGGVYEFLHSPTQGEMTWVGLHYKKAAFFWNNWHVLYQSHTDRGTSVLPSSKLMVNQSEGEVLRSLKKRSALLLSFYQSCIWVPKAKAWSVYLWKFTEGEQTMQPQTCSHVIILWAHSREEKWFQQLRRRRCRVCSHTFTLRAGLF